MLDLVLDQQAAADEAFDAHPTTARLERRDRAFARLLILTVLRRLGEIDAAFRPHLRFAPKERQAIQILRLGTAQLLFLKTPPHAAVNESIRLAGKRLAHLVPMLNAVLRKVAAGGPPARSEAEAALLDTPPWLLESWNAAYGPATAEAIAAAHLREAPLDIAVRSEPAHWAELLDGTIMPGGVIRRPHGAIEELPGFADGAWWVQDLAANLPARLLGDVKGHAVLDIGAAPGGKTMQLAAEGAGVTALDISNDRLARLQANLARTKLEAEIVAGDALTWRPPHPFPFILLDAPCSATGTIRRHPDAMRNRKPDDIKRQVESQRRMLDAAAEMLAPGGRLVFAVCSLQIEEGEAQVQPFLGRQNGRMRLDPVSPEELPGLEMAVNADGCVRTLPSHLDAAGGLDGFFIARFRRSSH
ncbi:16S rRNA (cytosine967-C5)-methyltransferase [Arboricoccus pini]|uniref:16S rRNA (Cytosine967-C5)-methyltransferase n=1 Tax=Arboricoccus pini TaxID=1963835 RepID=A0A212QYX5_9PROT|nr:16S rRNA (cytosine967-C5)-methyltransferase [Arboricoccus pini]